MFRPDERLALPNIDAVMHRQGGIQFWTATAKTCWQH
jgi:hypothetical protein